MGYTHYFQLKETPTEQAFTKFSNGARQLAQASGIRLNTEFTNESVIVNGIGKDEHETLVINKVSKRWEFCKTARKPYDEVVTSTLILAKYLFPSMYLSSDGNWGEWREGRELFTRVFHLEPAEGTVFDKIEAIYETRSYA